MAGAGANIGTGVAAEGLVVAGVAGAGVNSGAGVARPCAGVA